MKLARYLSLLLAALLLVTFSPQAASAQTNCRTFHTVLRGEGLYQIGLLYNLTWDQIATANNLANPNYVQAGTVLCIPQSTFGTGGPVNNNTSGCRTFHTVARGEELRNIAQFYGTTWNILAAANSLADPNYIQAGQVLCIPRTSATGGPTGTTPSTGQVTGAQCRVRHTVVAGENLFRVGLLYGLTWDQLLSANNITNPNALVAGTVICIPANPPAPQFGTGGPIVTNPTTPGTVGSPFVRTVTATFNRQNNQLVVSSTGFPANTRFDVYVAATATDFSRGILFSGSVDANGNLSATFTASNLTTDATQYVTVVGSQGYWGRATFAR